MRKENNVSTMSTKQEARHAERRNKKAFNNKQIVHLNLHFEGGVQS